MNLCCGGNMVASISQFYLSYGDRRWPIFLDKVRSNPTAGVSSNFLNQIRFILIFTISIEFFDQIVLHGIGSMFKAKIGPFKLECCFLLGKYLT